MKTLILILTLTFTANAQDWKLIKEMSGDITNHPGLTVKVSAAEIARGDEMVKVQIKAEFPEGAPFDIFRGNAPLGFDVSSINRMDFKVMLNCEKLTVKMVNNSGAIYQFNGNRLKSKEPPFALDTANVFVNYFCERGEAPTTAPILKPK